MERAVSIIPLYGFLTGQQDYTPAIESTAAYEILIQGGVHDENEINQETGRGLSTWRSRWKKKISRQQNRNRTGNLKRIWGKCRQNPPCRDGNTVPQSSPILIF